MNLGPFCQHGFKVQLARDSVRVWVGVCGRGGNGRGGLGWPEAASVGMLAGTFPAGGSSSSQCHKALWIKSSLNQALYAPGHDHTGPGLSLLSSYDGFLAGPDWASHVPASGPLHWLFYLNTETRFPTSTHLRESRSDHPT